MAEFLSRLLLLPQLSQLVSSFPRPSPPPISLSSPSFSPTTPNPSFPLPCLACACAAHSFSFFLLWPCPFSSFAFSPKYQTAPAHPRHHRLLHPSLPPSSLSSSSFLPSFLPSFSPSFSTLLFSFSFPNSINCLRLSPPRVSQIRSPQPHKISPSFHVQLCQLLSPPPDGDGDEGFAIQWRLCDCAVQLVVIFGWIYSVGVCSVW